jgi:hypothetical protein
MRNNWKRKGELRTVKDILRSVLQNEVSNRFQSHHDVPREWVELLESIDRAPNPTASPAEGDRLDREDGES